MESIMTVMEAQMKRAAMAWMMILIAWLTKTAATHQRATSTTWLVCSRILSSCGNQWFSLGDPNHPDAQYHLAQSCSLCLKLNRWVPWYIDANSCQNESTHLNLGVISTRCDRIMKPYSPPCSDYPWFAVFRQQLLARQFFPFHHPRGIFCVIKSY